MQSLQFEHSGNGCRRDMDGCWIDPAFANYVLALPTLCQLLFLQVVVWKSIRKKVRSL
jgi:hypothetical protein